ncbi:hypothetical protein ACFCYF_32250 [Streptomyces chartreusis]|uniref:hypothetical protein n=1 Tax=Streptomyces chartreusis TaxID=1969 RepID=UPI0035E171C5
MNDATKSVGSESHLSHVTCCVKEIIEESFSSIFTMPTTLSSAGSGNSLFESLDKNSLGS